MKKIICGFCLLIAALLFIPSAMNIPSAQIKADEGYTYMVRIYAGKEGTFDSGSSYVTQNGVTGTVEEDGAYILYKDVKPGDVISFNRSVVLLNEGSKYYIKEIRESGKDNYDLENPQLSAFTVQGDEDYVVAYALLGSSVAYTVNYVDVDGNPVMDSKTFYGNVGDKPVIAYQYKSGYYPQAYNLTGVLVEDASKNVFTFVYQSVTPKEVIIEGEGEGEEGGAGAGGNGTGWMNYQGTGINGGVLPNDQNDTQQIIDIDGNDTPKGGGDGTENPTEGPTEGPTENPTEGPTEEITNPPTPTSNGGKSLGWIIGGICGVAAVALIIAIVAIAKKKQHKS